MARAYKCEICGEYADNDPFHSGGGEIEYCDGVHPGFLQVDLCSRCMEKLIMFVNSERKKNITSSLPMPAPIKYSDDEPF